MSDWYLLTDFWMSRVALWSSSIKYIAEKALVARVFGSSQGIEGVIICEKT